MRFFRYRRGTVNLPFEKTTQLNLLSFSLIKLCGKVVKSVEKSYVDKLVSRNPFNFNILVISPELLIDQTKFLPDIS